MLFHLCCVDKPDSLELRLATRESHLAYVSGHTEKLVLAGPLLSDDGEAMQGSLFIINAASREEVENFTDQDPYNQAGLFGEVTITRFKQVVP
jgi:uncharacterized protein YciI